MSFTLELMVVPRSSINKLIQESNSLKLKITAPPVDGEANKEIINFLAKSFSCPKTSILLISGFKSKKKKFLFEKLSPEQGQEALNKLLNN